MYKRIFLLVKLLIFSFSVYSQYGTIDSSFDMSIGFNSEIRASAVDNDGKIYVGGSFSSALGSSQSYLVRLNPDGTVDESFDCTVSSSVRVIKIHTDGKIYIGGSFGTVNGVTSTRLARLNPDGSLDESFAVGTGFDAGVTDLKILPNGRILVVGSFSTYKGQSANKIAKLLGNGNLDTSFSVGTGFDNTINSIDVFSNGKILVGGSMTVCNSTAIGRIARLNEDGSLDNTFLPQFNNYINRIQIVANDKIYVFGEFTGLNNVSQIRGVRLNYDGTKDESFNIGSGFASIVQDFIAEPNGKIIAVGNFTTFNSTNVKHIVRLHPTGNIDNTFNIGTGFGSSAVYVTLQPDGKILVGGIFSSYQGYVANRFVRINNCISASSGEMLAGIIERVGIDVLRAKFTGNSYQWYSCDGTPIAGETNRTLVSPGAGSYYVIITTDCGQMRSSCIEISCVSAPYTQNVNTCILPYTWINGVEYFDNTTDTYLIPGAAAGGCDSLVYLNLVIEDLEAPVPSLAELPAFERYCYLTPLPVPTAIDACSGVIQGELHVYDSSTQGDQVVTWKYVDDAGNVTYQDQTVMLKNINLSLTVDEALLSFAFDEPGTTYQWVRCDLGYLPVTGAINSSYTPTESGSYSVNFWLHGCAYSSHCHEFIFVDEEDNVSVENAVNDHFSIYPNPSKGQITIDFTTNQINTSVQVIDVMGRVIQQINVVNTNQSTIEIDGSVGMYTIQVVNADGVTTKKINVVR